MDVGVVASVVGTTCACASAITRAMLRRTPLSCSGWPLADCVGGCVRIGLPDCDSVPCALGCTCSGLRACRYSSGACTAGAAPSLAASGRRSGFTSSRVTVPSGPLAANAARCRRRAFLPVARTAGIALTPPTAIAALPHARCHRPASRRPRCRHPRFGGSAR
jgi:hypothetical protein